jgi:hypothetical protein
MYTEVIYLFYYPLIHLAHKLTKPESNYNNNNGDDDFGNYGIFFVHPDQGQSKRTKTKQADYNSRIGIIPLCRWLWLVRAIEELIAKTALDRLILNLFCTKGAFLHDVPLPNAIKNQLPIFTKNL